MTDKMLAAFAAARRTGSFSTAAWELSMTQQSVSYSIKKLEETLGIGNGIIARWETSAPSVTRVKAVADFFGVTVDELLTENKEEAENGQETE